ncbi:muconolactone Delta-isomerase family protein [Glaciihabitans sp. UYNi722]|uniref:muconolactone Delta-isomerase family protein n=1 Tax=Glaciihabitans sp. UYNi722 TaxID=3156344 RepID=UPI0033922F2A
MEFLIEKITTLPDDFDPQRSKALRREEKNAIASFAADGSLVRLWRLRRGNRVVTLGLWRAESEGNVRSLIDQLPLRPWMAIEVFVLEPHSNDPRPSSNEARSTR